MRKADIICLFAVILFFLPFFLFPGLFHIYWHYNLKYPYLLAFVKFFILAPFGEILGLRIKKGVYYEKGFGWLSRAFVWGWLGVSLKMAFDIFSAGAPHMLADMGFNIPEDIMVQPFSLKKLFVSFSIGASLNLFYAPLLMITHKVTDEHIWQTEGNFLKFFTHFKVSEYLQQLDWKTQWNFVFKKTILFFWIPAQTINFLLPDEVRILVAALLSIVLGVLLAVAARMKS